MRALRIAGSVLVLSALMLQASRAAAQSRMLIVGGAAISQLGGSDSEGAGYTKRTGIYFNVASELPLWRFLTVAPGGSYIDRGYNFPNGINDVKLSYLEVSAPLRINLALSNAFSVVLFGGPGIALSFGCVFTEEDGNVLSTIDCQSSDFDLSSWDLTGIVGGGLSIAVAGPTRLLVNAGYDTSLRTIDTGTPRADLRHTSVLISAGVSFPLQRR